MIARILVGSLLFVALAACSNSGSPSSNSTHAKPMAKAAATAPVVAKVPPANASPMEAATMAAPPILSQALDYSEANEPRPGSIPAAGSSTDAALALPDISARAAANPSSPGVSAEVEAVTQKLAAAHPDVAGNVLQVSRIGLPNSTLFEVVTPQAVLYTDKDVNYLMVGQLLVGNKGDVQDITHRPALEVFRAAKAKESAAAAPPQSGGEAAAADTGGKSVFDALPFATGWTTSYPGAANVAIPASHRVVVFEDPDCEFCQKLNHDLPEIGKQVGGLSVTVFPFVLETQHPHGLAHAYALICSADPAKYWASWMAFAYDKDTDLAWSQWAPKNATVTVCPRTKLIDAWQTAGHALGFAHTPTLMFPSGASVGGALTAEQFNQVFQMLDTHPDTWTQVSASSAPSSRDLGVLGAGAPAPVMIPPGNPSTTVPQPMNRPVAPPAGQNAKELPSGVKLNNLLSRPAAGVSTQPGK